MSDIAVVGLVWLGVLAALVPLFAWALRDRRREERDLEVRFPEAFR